MARIPDCACLDVRILVLNEIWIIDFSSALDGMLMNSYRLFLFSKCSVVKHVAVFTICAKLTMAFIFTSLPLKFSTSVPDVVVVSDLNKNIG